MSAKHSVQPGRRTPLSLSGAVTKTAPLNKGSNNISNGGGINSNGHPAPSNTKDNKLHQQKGDQPAVNNSEARETPIKKEQPQSESKKSNEKSQCNASSSNKPETSENKQQQPNKERAQQHQNGNDENKVNEKEKSEKSNKLEKPKDKTEKDITKSKEDKKREHIMPQIKKDEKKTKESKDSKDDKKEVPSKSDGSAEKQQQVKGDNKSKDDREKDRNVAKKPEEKMDIVEEQITQKSSNPATPKSNSKVNRTSTPVDKTPTKIVENSAQMSTPTNRVKTTTTPAYKKVETTTIDDNEIEMEPLAIESSPVKTTQPQEVTNIKIVPSATSTPGKLYLSKRRSDVPKADVQLAMQLERSPERPRMFSQISGRKSIRPISDYTPSKFQSNLQFRESYRRINTELDVTNTSMNVTVGSEVASNFSFSLFGRGRKRDRASPPPHSQSDIGELVVELSPPKKARLDIHAIFSAVSSPISLLRNRFSKASLQSSTPFKLQQNLNTDEDEIEVQNVSGVSVEEEITTADKEAAEINSSTHDNDASLGEEAKETKLTAKEGKEFSYDLEESCEQSDIKSTETSMQSVAVDEMAKNKKCVVM